MIYIITHGIIHIDGLIDHGYYPRIRGNLRRKWYDKWNDYKHRLDGHNRHYKHHKYDKPIKKIVKSHKVQSPKAVSHSSKSKAQSPKRNKLTTLHGAVQDYNYHECCLLILGKLSI